MTKDTFSERLNKLRKIIKSGDIESIKGFQEKLKEQGVRSLIVIPLFEEYLGYDQLEYYTFEYQISGLGSSKLPAVDILINDNLIIETKPFNSLSIESNKREGEEQLRKYIKPKDDNIFYGLLTDGIIWEFMIDKSFLKKDIKGEVDILDDIPICLTFKIQDENFLHLMMLFHKDLYVENIKKLSDGIVKTVQGTKGGFGWQNIFAKIDDITLQVKCGDYVKNQVLDVFKIKKGELYQDIKDGKITPNINYFIEDDYLKIVFTIMPNGFIKIIPEKTILKPEKQLAVSKQYPQIINLFFNTWPSDEQAREYESLKELLKNLQDTSKITTYGAALIEKYKKC